MWPLAWCGQRPDHLIFVRGRFRKTLINPFSPEPKAKLGYVFYGIESLLRQYCVQNLTGLSEPNVYNGSELKLVWCIADNRNGNTVVFVSEIRHD